MYIKILNMTRRFSLTLEPQSNLSAGPPLIGPRAWTVFIICRGALIPPLILLW